MLLRRVSAVLSFQVGYRFVDTQPIWKNNQIWGQGSEGSLAAGIRVGTHPQRTPAQTLRCCCHGTPQRPNRPHAFHPPAREAHPDARCQLRVCLRPQLPGKKPCQQRCSQRRCSQWRGVGPGGGGPGAAAQLLLPEPAQKGVLGCGCWSSCCRRGAGSAAAWHDQNSTAACYSRHQQQPPQSRRHDQIAAARRHAYPAF